MSQLMGLQSDNLIYQNNLIIQLVQNDWVIQENIHTSNGRDGRFSLLPPLDILILLLLSAVEFCLATSDSTISFCGVSVYLFWNDSLVIGS
jgi:hypothetical protein